MAGMNVIQLPLTSTPFTCLARFLAFRWSCVPKEKTVPTLRHKGEARGLQKM